MAIPVPKGTPPDTLSERLQRVVAAVDRAEQSVHVLIREMGREDLLEREAKLTARPHLTLIQGGRAD